MITHEEVAETLDRIARTPDGVMLFDWLQRVMMELGPKEDSGALLAHEGERNLASRIRRMMNKGIVESGGRDTRIITFALPAAKRVSNSHGAERRGGFNPNSGPGDEG